MNGGTDAGVIARRIEGLRQIVDSRYIDPILREYGTGRYCKQLSNPQLVWIIVGLGLFVDKSYRELYRTIISPLATAPPRATIGLARKRLPEAAFMRLQETLVSLLALSPRKHPLAFYKGLRLMAVDGTLLDCYDSDSNRQAFGRTGNQSGYGAYPKARVVTLCELGTRVLWRNRIGSYHDSEQTLVRELFGFLTREMLLLADRHFGVAPLLFDLLDRRVPFLIRAKKSRVLPVHEVLSDGSYLSTIYRHKNDRARHRPGQRIRVIKYTINDPVRCEQAETHVLLTTLLDEKKHPAKELIELYHTRWEEEIAFKEWKQILCRSSVLRSQSPELVRQEIWGSLIAHFVIRKLIVAAADEAGVAPCQISFKATLNIVHLHLAEVPRGSRGKRRWFKAMIQVISLEVLPPRQNRINPRVVKKRSTGTPTKHDDHRRPPPPKPDFLDTVRISI